MIVLVFSLDADGTYFNALYFHYLNQMNNNHKEALIFANKALLDRIVEIIRHAKAKYPNDEIKVELISFSLRQSIALDNLNSNNNQTCSACVAIEYLRDILNERLQNEKIPQGGRTGRKIFIKANLDKYLLQDTFSSRQDGATHNTLTSSVSYGHSDRKKMCTDHTKVSIAYTQMHRFATRFPLVQIKYHVFDDKYNRHNYLDDALYHMATYFKYNPRLMPCNIELVTHQVGCSQGKIINGLGVVTQFVRKRKSVTGEGGVNNNYKKDIKGKFLTAHGISSCYYAYDWLRAVTGYFPPSIISGKINLSNATSSYKRLLCDLIISNPQIFSCMFLGSDNLPVGVFELRRGEYMRNFANNCKINLRLLSITICYGLLRDYIKDVAPAGNYMWAHPKRSHVRAVRYFFATINQGLLAQSRDTEERKEGYLNEESKVEVDNGVETTRIPYDITLDQFLQFFNGEYEDGNRIDSIQALLQNLRESFGAHYETRGYLLNPTGSLARRLNAVIAVSGEALTLEDCGFTLQQPSPSFFERLSSAF